jgi:hypothetical protein
MMLTAMIVELYWNNADSSTGRQACPSTMLTTTYWSGIEQLRTPRFCQTTDEVKLLFYKENIRILFTDGAADFLQKRQRLFV